MPQDSLDELDLDLHEEKPRADKRVEQLFAKVKNAEQEKAEALAKAQEAEASRAALEKERDFFASFSDVAAKYSSASEYKDQIKEKVMSGYSVEDAAVAVLNAQGRLAPSAPVAPPPPAPVAGGSAANVMPEYGQKTAKDMTQSERLEMLLQAERQGDIFIS